MSDRSNEAQRRFGSDSSSSLAARFGWPTSIRTRRSVIRNPNSIEKVDADLKRLASLQERIFAERKHRILIVLQGIDASGKDGTISHVMTGFNPQGCRVVGFSVPSAVELAHDYLWRIHDAVPGNGDIVIFNRSHYESVLVGASTTSCRRTSGRRRYDQINAFEEMLSREGTTIIKFFLHIDRDEQLSGSRPATTIRRSAGSSRSATSRSAHSGTTTRRRSRTRCGSARPRSRRGT